MSARASSCLWLAALLALAAPAPRAAAAPPTTLTVYAAASLSESFTELGTAFEKSHRGVQVRFNFAGSQTLAGQLAQGAIADVFASADDRWMQDAASRGLLLEAPVPFTRNQLVAIVPATNPARLHGLRDLARGGLKLVIAAEAVPVGHYTRQVLATLARTPGYPADYAQRALANVVSDEDNVKGVVLKVRLAEADAGFVYRSDVTPALKRYLHEFEIPADANVTATYPIAVLKDAPQAELARAFVGLLRSPAGQAALARYRFLPAPADSLAR